MLWKGVPRFSLYENHFKLRQQYDQNFHTDGKPLQNKYLGQTTVRVRPQGQDCEGCENHSQESKMKCYPLAGCQVCHFIIIIIIVIIIIIIIIINFHYLSFFLLF